MKVLVRLALGGVAVYLALLAGVYALMRRPPEQFASAIANVPGPAFLLIPFETLWTRARAGHLSPGDAAPDFDLPTLDRKDRVRLSSFRGQRPVVLVFGSYT